MGGRGGSQHIHWKNFYSNGIQGGIVPIAAGMALAEKVKDTCPVSVLLKPGLEELTVSAKLLN